MSATIYSVIKSRPSKVRRSCSDTSLSSRIDVFGSVVKNKVWMFEDDNQIQDDDSWTGNFEAGGDNCCRKHVWFIFTNLATAQFCVKFKLIILNNVFPPLIFVVNISWLFCSGRMRVVTEQCARTVRTRRAAYKCLECKRLGHLKCVSQYVEAAYEGQEFPCRSPSYKSNVIPQDVSSPAKPRSPFTDIGNVGGFKTHEQPASPRKKTDLYKDENDVGPGDTLQERKFEDDLDGKEIEDKSVDNSSKTHDVSIQSQAKERYNSVKQSCAKRYRSFRKKLGKLKQNLPSFHENAGKKDFTCCTSYGDKDSVASLQVTEEEAKREEKAAWIRSPIRNRVIDNDEKTLSQNRVRKRGGNMNNVTVKRPLKRRYIDGSWNFDFEKLQDRLEAVERKIQRLEKTIPEDVGEWKRLLLKFSNDVNSPSLAVSELLHQYTDQNQQLRMTGSNSKSGSEEIAAVEASGQETSSSCHDNNGYFVRDGGLCQDESLLHSVDPPPQLHLDVNGLNSDFYTDQQTSTPVTNRELSFRSASRKFQATEIGLNSMASLPTDNSVEEFERMERECARDKAHISPLHITRNAFFPRRPSPLSQTVGNRNQNFSVPSQISPNTIADLDTRTGIYTSPGSGSDPIASSTFRNGDSNALNTDLSPVSFTFRNDVGDPDASQSYAKLILEDSKQEEAKRSGSDGKNSVLSFTFRNDSSMCATANEEILELITQTAESTCFTEDPHPNLQPDTASRRDINTNRIRDTCPDSLDMDIRSLETDGAEGNARILAVGDTMSLTNVTDFTGDYQNSFSDITRVRTTGLTSEQNITLRKTKSDSCRKKDRKLTATTDVGVSTNRKLVALGEEPGLCMKFELYAEDEEDAKFEHVDEKGDCKDTLETNDSFICGVPTFANMITTKPPPAVKVPEPVSCIVDSSIEASVDVRSDDHHSSGTHTPVSSAKLRPVPAHGDAKYHFLNPQGMIKICSPRLELLSDNPSKPGYASHYHDLSSVTETTTETDSGSHRASAEGCKSGSSLSNMYTLDSKSSQSSIMQNLTDSGELNGDLQAEILQQCIDIVDEGERNWDTVLEWVNKGYNTKDVENLEKELESLRNNEDNASSYDEHSENVPDESVYYSFQGQSEEIENLLTQIEDNTLKAGYESCGLLNLVKEKNEQKVRELLQSDATISESEIKDALEWSLQQQVRPIVQLILEDICRLIQASEEEDVIEVWPGYRKAEPWKPVFVLLTKSKYKGEWDTFMGYDLFKRRYDYVSLEAVKVINSDIVCNNPLSIEDFSLVRKAINSNQVQKQHSKITVINACSCRSRKEGEDIQKELCIVIHCLVKGIIPFDEDSFPATMSGIPVDVREGYFCHGVKTPPQTRSPRPWNKDTSPSEDSRSQMSDDLERSRLPRSSAASGSQASLMSGLSSYSSSAEQSEEDRDGDVLMGYERMPGPAGDAEMIKTLNVKQHTQQHQALLNQCEGIQRPDIPLVPGPRSTDYNQTLLLGSGIGRAGSLSRGTIGGFVFLPDGSIALLTCAHVLGQPYTSECSEGQLITQPADGDMPPSQISSRSLCGQVVKVVFCQGSVDSTGVDAALIQVTDRHPLSGDFIWIRREQLMFAGFDSEDMPTFSGGKILRVKDITPKKRHQSVLKVGAETGLTKGDLYLHGSYIRINNRELRLPNHSMIEFFNQIEVNSIAGCSTTFFNLGDSGALVFMPLNGSELHCIGLAVGCTSYHSCIVTPIENVFQELGLPLKFIDFTRTNSSQ